MFSAKFELQSKPFFRKISMQRSPQNRKKILPYIFVKSKGKTFELFASLKTTLSNHGLVELEAIDDDFSLQD